MSKSSVNLTVKDSGFNAKLKNAMNTFTSLGNAANNARSQFTKFADGLAQVAQAQQLVNNAIKGNPYGLLAQAASAAFTKIIEKATEATDAEKRAMAWAEERSERQQAANEAIGRSTGELMAKYETLRVQWVALSNEQEKTEWINKNQSAFKSLNLAVNDVTSAENAFVKNTAQVVAALKARAKAEAYGELYKDQIKKNAMNKATGQYNAQLITDPYYRPSEIEAQAAGFTAANKSEMYEYRMVDNADPRNPGKHREWTGRLSAEGLRRLNQNRQMGASTFENADRMQAEYWGNMMTQAQAEAQALGKGLFGPVGGSGGRSGRGENKLSPEELQAKYWEKAMLKSGVLASNIKPEPDTGPSQAWMAYASSMASAFEEPISPLQKLNKELAEMKANLENAPDTQSYQQGLSLIAEKEKEIAKFKGETKTEDIAKDTEDAWKGAANAMASVGSAMASIEDPTAKTVGIVMQAIATVAQAFSQALSEDKTTTGNIWAFIAAALASTASMVSVISSIHSATGYAQGGIVSGNSYSGDQIPIRANAGEVVLTRAMAGNLASQLEGNGLGNLNLTATVSAEQIRFTLNNNGRRTGRGEFVQTNSR